MNAITWPYIIVLFGAAQGVMLSIALSFRKGVKSKANQVLIPFVLAVSLMLVIAAIFSLGVVSAHSKIGYLGDSVLLLYGPLFYFYTSRLLTTSRQKIFPHLLPFFLFFLINTTVLFLPINIYQVKWLGLFYWITLNVALTHMTVYFVFSYRAIHKYQKQSKDDLSFNPTTQYLKTLVILIGSCTLLFSFNAYSNLFGVDLGWTFLTYQIQWVIFASVIFVLGHYAIRQPTIFQLSPKVETSVSINTEELEVVQDLVSRLKACMDLEKPYLKSDLTLEDLANQIGCRKELLSKAINQGLSTNFYGLVNQYRINEFERLALDSKNKHLTHLALALEAGFRSKTTFYKAFKTLKQTTPSAHLKTM